MKPKKRIETRTYQDRREYQRAYQRRWKESRKTAARLFLGGSCVDCGSTDLATLQFDHVDPFTKLAKVTRLLDLGISLDSSALQNEMSKCQLRCEPCHIARTEKENHYATRR